MKLTRLRCPNCGADFENIDVTEDQKVFKCTRLGCGASFILDQGIRFADIKQAEAEKIRHYREELKRSLSPFDRHLAGRYAGNILAILPDDYRAKAILAIAQSGEQNSRPLYYFLQSEPACTPEEFEEVFPYLLERCDYRGLNLLRDAVAAVEPEDRQQQFLEKIDRQVAYIKRKVEDYADIPRDIFVCHSSDDLGIVMKMVDVLEADGNKCWYSERNMPPDSLHYWEKIKEAIRRCTIFLVCCSGSAMLSDPVQTEIRLAEEAGVKRLELKLDDTPHTSLFKHFFNGISWVKLDDDFDGAMEQLKEFIYQLKRGSRETEREVAEIAAENERMLAEQRRRQEQYEELLRKQEEEKRQQEESLRLEEEQRKAEELKRQQEAEEKRIQEELRRQEEKRKQQEEQKRLEELERQRQAEEEHKRLEEIRWIEDEQKRQEEQRQKEVQYRKLQAELPEWTGNNLKRQQENQRRNEEQERQRHAAIAVKQAAEEQKRREEALAEEQELERLKEQKKKYIRGCLISFFVGIILIVIIWKPIIVNKSTKTFFSKSTEVPTATPVLKKTIIPTKTAIPVSTLKPLSSFSELRVGDEISFGTYEQDNDLTNGKEPIIWHILEVTDGRALVISKYGLDQKLYDENLSTKWETCSLRKWLNEDFYKSVFTLTEISQIDKVRNGSQNDLENEIQNGDDDRFDHIFLLSGDEANKYFPSDSDKQCKATEHASINGAFINASINYNGNTCWWLRPTETKNRYAPFIGSTGHIFELAKVTDQNISVRPAFWLILSESDNGSVIQPTIQPLNIEKTDILPKPTKTPTPSVVKTSNLTITPRPEGPLMYTVQKGDTCWNIAANFGVSFELFMTINNFSLDTCPIAPDDQVIIPSANSQMPTSTPIPLELFTTGQMIEYFVEMNDSYQSIALKFNTTLDSISKLNNIEDVTEIPQIGQKLQIAVNLITSTPTPVWGIIHIDNNPGVYVRSTPSVNAKVIRGYYNDNVLEITGESVVVDGIKWVSVRTSDGYDGWITENALQTATPEVMNEALTHTSLLNNFSELKVGDEFTFGKYEQNNIQITGLEPIKWQVLALEDGHALVISKYALDYKKFNETDEIVTWENCSLRKWLNETFYNNTFTDEEKSLIMEVKLGETEPPEFVTKNADADADRIFLLSINEAESLFSSDYYRRCYPSRYAIANGAKGDVFSGTIWWLRSLGDDNHNVGYVSISGVVSTRIKEEYKSVRPAFWLNLFGSDTITATIEPTSTAVPILSNTSKPINIDVESLWKKGEDAYQNGEYGKALEYLVPAAEAGSSYAQFRLGYMYDSGLGVTQSFETAVKFYQIAADQGHDTAQFNLGIMYQYGLGVTQSYETAVKYYQMAADQGLARAQDNLGAMYQYGRGVTQSYETAVKYYQMAANQGYDLAQYDLGRMFENGLGVEKSYETAVKYYQMASDQGNDLAQNDLGRMFENGRGVTQSYETAVKYYQMAANQGYDLAQYNLGRMYENGLGVEKSYETAIKYYKMSADQGYKVAIRKIQSLNN